MVEVFPPQSTSRIFGIVGNYVLLVMLFFILMKRFYSGQV